MPQHEGCDEHFSTVERTPKCAIWAPGIMVLTLKDAPWRCESERAKQLRGRVGTRQWEGASLSGVPSPHTLVTAEDNCLSQYKTWCHTTSLYYLLWLRNPEAAELGDWGSGSLVRLWARPQSCEPGGAIPRSPAGLWVPRGPPCKGARGQLAAPRASVTQQIGKSLVLL